MKTDYISNAFFDETQLVYPERTRELVLAAIRQDQRLAGRSNAQQATAINARTGGAIATSSFDFHIKGERQPNRAAMQTYIAYALAEGLLSPAEIETGEFRGDRAGFYFSAFLERAIDRNTPLPPDRISGRYLAKHPRHGAVYADVGPLREDGTMEWAERRRENGTLVTSSGIAVLTPEEWLIVVLKTPPHGKNHYYTLLCAVDLWSDAMVNRLVLGRQSYPLEVQEADPEKIASAVTDAVIDNMFVFERIVDDEDCSAGHAPDAQDSTGETLPANDSAHDIRCEDEAVARRPIATKPRLEASHSI